MHLKKLLFPCLILFIFTSCSSSTVIRSNPTGADVYLDGVYYGKTPVEYSDKKVSLSTLSVRLKKEGYREEYLSVPKDGTVKLGPTLCGCATLPILLPVAWLWSLGYEKMYIFELYEQ